MRYSKTKPILDTSISVVEFGNPAASWTFILLNGKTEIGKLIVHKDQGKNLVWSSEITTRFRNRGLGKELYSFAISYLGSLSTNYFNVSPHAQRLWKSLSRDFNMQTEFFNGQLTLYGEKNLWSQKTNSCGK